MVGTRGRKSTKSSSNIAVACHSSEDEGMRDMYDSEEEQEEEEEPTLRQKTNVGFGVKIDGDDDDADYRLVSWYITRESAI